MGLSDWWTEHVIKPIHRARIPLPPIFGVPGHVYMSAVYPTLVLVGGYAVMQWSISKSHENIGVRGEKLLGRTDLGVNDAQTRAQNEALQVTLDKVKTKRDADKNSSQ